MVPPHLILARVFVPHPSSFGSKDISWHIAEAAKRYHHKTASENVGFLVVIVR